MAAVPPDRLSDVLITEQLHRRVPHNADYKREKLAIQELAQQMVDHPEGLMPGLVRLAIEACDAQSAGISLYEPDPPGPGIFRWHHLAGHFANLSGGTIPRDFSPSGIAIDQGVPILMARPERFYAYLARAGVPLFLAIRSHRAAGTLGRTRRLLFGLAPLQFFGAIVGGFVSAYRSSKVLQQIQMP